jgi:hypothetical protein
MSEIDWKHIFTRYVDIVGQAEGVDFLYDYQWNEEEWEAIQEVLYGERTSD